jgi:hypothetical protein
LNISLASILLVTTLVGPGYVCAGTGADALKETANMRGFLPKDGMVPNAQTAIAIAIAVWNPVYVESRLW